MTLDLKIYARRRFEVDAVQLTESNLEEVARWCQGEICNRVVDGASETAPYIRVKVYRPASQGTNKQAYVGDWILKSEQGYKVYSSTALENSFVYMGENSAEYMGNPYNENIFDFIDDEEVPQEKEMPAEISQNPVAPQHSDPREAHRIDFGSKDKLKNP